LLALFLLRVFQGSAFKIVAYAAGLTRVPFVPYLAVSTAGMIPGTLLWYTAARWVGDPLAFTALSFGLGAAFTAAFAVAGALGGKRVRGLIAPSGTPPP
jgi:uncharacterized membrane protein YdjX (TVP38/TMEM64 family)